MPPLTKHEIAEYYSDSGVRAAILAQVRDRPTMVVQSRPSKSFVRRKAPDGTPIRILQALNDSANPNDLAWYTQRRYSEFHPSIGKKTKQVWVDIDPGPKRTIEDLKPVVTDVDNALKRMPEVKDTRISFSGGRGFYVRGDLHRKANTDQMRELVRHRIDALSLANAVGRPPKGHEVRLDTSTLRNKGSIRADYSINSETGRVALPLTQRELRGFAPEQAEVTRILKEKEFAPGIPRSKRVYALPESKDSKQWTMAIQQHDAKKAGKHWDLRLVDPATGFAHSWAIPRASFPEGAEKILAVRTPTHTAHYALNFGDIEPQIIRTGYGRGTVRIVHKEPVSVTQTDNNKLKFERIIGDGSGEKFSLFRTKNNMWLLRKDKQVRTEDMKKQSAFGSGYHDALVKLGLAIAKETNALEKRQNNDAPVQVSDQHLPVGRLVSAMANLDFVPDPVASAEPSASRQRSRSEERLNKPVEWSTASSIPSYFMDGPVPILSGRF